jgi:hypothetical protein
MERDRPGVTFLNPSLPDLIALRTGRITGIDCPAAWQKRKMLVSRLAAILESV